MNSYYQSLIKEIQSKINEFAYQEAYDLIHQELSMPYVPSDVMDILEAYQSECISHMDCVVKKLDDDKLMKLIHGSEEQIERAISELMNLNLRQYSLEVQAVLDSIVLDEFKGELIEALMEQRIDTPFKILKNGLEITFIPSSILTAQEDHVLNETKAIFYELLSNENPAFYQFCLRLLEQEKLEMRPFDFSDLNPYAIAKSIIRLVMEAFGQSDDFLTFMKIKGLEEVPLLIETRGENDAK